jgi:hypothetical protein
MASLQERLRAVLAEVLPVDAEADGALTLHHGGTIASLRVVPITDDLELVSLTQIVAWDLVSGKKIRDRVAEQSRATLLGSVNLVDKPGRIADIVLRYNFPGNGLNDEGLRTLVLMALDKGAEIRGAVTA